MSDRSEDVQHGLHIAIVGATGSAGSDLVQSLDRSSLPVGTLTLIGGPSGRRRSVELDERIVSVTPSPGGEELVELVEDADLVICACPPEVTRSIAPGIVDAGPALLDLGGALLGQGAFGVGLAGGIDEERFRESRILSTPGPAGVLLASVLAPLAALGLKSASGTVLQSAGVDGREGVEELSSQVVALFNHSDPRRSVYPEGLAFDLHAQVGTRTPETGWTASERRLALELGAALRRAPADFGMTVARVPMFTGIAASLQVRFHQPRTAEQVGPLLAQIPFLRLEDPVLGPRHLDASPVAHVGRLRDDPRGDGVHLWAAADNLRFGASTNTLALVRQLVNGALL